MKLSRPDIAALVLLGVVVVCVTILSVLHESIPEILSTIGLVLVGTAGGAAFPRANGADTTAFPRANGADTTAAAPALPVQVPAPAAAPAVESIPAPVPATHAP